MFGNRLRVTAIGYGSTSDAQIGSIPQSVPARGNPPDPSNRLPILYFILSSQTSAASFASSGRTSRAMPGTCRCGAAVRAAPAPPARAVRVTQDFVFRFTCHCVHPRSVLKFVCRSYPGTPGTAAARRYRPRTPGRFARSGRRTSRTRAEAAP